MPTLSLQQFISYGLGFPILALIPTMASGESLPCLAVTLLYLLVFLNIRRSGLSCVFISFMNFLKKLIFIVYSAFHFWVSFLSLMCITEKPVLLHTWFLLLHDLNHMVGRLDSSKISYTLMKSVIVKVYITLCIYQEKPV